MVSLEVVQFAPMTILKSQETLKEPWLRVRSRGTTRKIR